MSWFRGVVAAGLCLFVVFPLFGQSAETPVYREQFSDLLEMMNGLYRESMQEEISDHARLSLEGRFFAVQKTAHRLQEQASEADIESERSGRSTDKQLRLIEQGCMGVDDVVTSLTNYLVTDDRTFLVLAANSKNNLSVVIKVLQLNGDSDKH